MKNEEGMGMKMNYVVWFYPSTAGDPHGLHNSFQVIEEGVEWSDGVRGDGHSYRGPALHEPLGASSLEEAHRKGHLVMRYLEIMKEEEE